MREIAGDVVARSMKAGATAAESVVREGSEFSTLVRLGQVETLKEAGSRALGLRVFFGQRAASTYSSDFSEEGIQRLVKGALELARGSRRKIHTPACLILRSWDRSLAT